MAHHPSQEINEDALLYESMPALADASLDPIFWRAERLGAISAWWAHVPFAFWLVANLRPRTVVELGTHAGVSYSAFCEAVLREKLPARCFAIDTWEGDAQAGLYGEDVYADFCAFHDRRYSAFSATLRSTFDDAVGQFEDGSIDLLHIDGLHTYDAVKHDFENWWPKLSSSAVVLLHDTNERQHDFGVWRFWHELTLRFPNFEFVHGHGLGVLSRGRNLDGALGFLLSIDDPAVTARVRDRFAFAGDLWVTEMRERAAQREIATREQRVVDMQNSLAQLHAENREASAQHAEQLRELRATLEADYRATSAKLEAELAAAKSAARAEARLRMTAIDELRGAQAELETLKDSSGGSELDSSDVAVSLTADLEVEKARTAELKRRLAKAITESETYPVDRCRSLGNLHAYIEAQLGFLIESPSAFEHKQEERKRKELAVRARLQSLAAEMKTLRVDVREQASWRQAAQTAAKAARDNTQSPGKNTAARSWSKVAKRAIRLGSLGRARRALKHERFAFEKRIVAASGLFDAEWYGTHYPDVRAQKVDPLEHYLRTAYSEARNPGPHFDAGWYVREHRDVSSSGTHPLVHYLEFGLAEGREIRPVVTRPAFAPPADVEAAMAMLKQSPLFDVDWYSQTYAEDIAPNQDPAMFYVSSPNAVYQHPSVKFDAIWYLDRHPDVASSGMNPLVHYLKCGLEERREIRPLLLPEDKSSWDDEVRSHDAKFWRRMKDIAESAFFDAEWYKREYREIERAGVNPLVHYLRTGAFEIRNPGPEFDARWYLETYPEVREAGLNPLVHYLEKGVKEGRAYRAVQAPARHEAADDALQSEVERQLKVLAESGLFDGDWYTAQYPDVASSGVTPLLHYVENGYKEGRNPGPDFDAKWYLNRNADVAKAGVNPLLHYIECGRKEGRRKRGVAEWPTIQVAVASRFNASEPLPAVLVPGTTKRLNLVTDSINAGSLFGGVGTAIMMAASLAQRMQADLRVITRTEKPHRQNFTDVLRVNSVDFKGAVEFVHADVNTERPIQISKADLFLTTSWWTTRCVSRTVDSRRIAYLLQEDERMFYPFGDDRLRCRETLSNPDITVAVNSELLFKHLTLGPDAIAGMESRAVWFEPAFPQSHYYLDPSALNGKEKKKLFFYARPNNARNLYWRGLEALGAALEENLLPSNKWEVHFVGRALEKLDLPGGSNLHLHEDLSWAEYAALVRQMDLGLCLMDTPHPSYPPLDLAASGVVVVTNTHGSKDSLDRYSANILCYESSVDGLKAGLCEGALLAQDSAQRFQNYRSSHILRDWPGALAPVVENVARGLVRSLE